MKDDPQIIIEQYLAFIQHRRFSCVAAKAAAAKQQVRCMVAGNMACPRQDGEILQFLYAFIREYRVSQTNYHTAAIIFQRPECAGEELFDSLLWQRLQGLSTLDAESYPYDRRVNDDPSSPNFSFSIREEAFYIIGLHPGSSRASRRFLYPTLVFNPHAQFEQLRNADKYENMKKVIRKREIALSGSVNPMLADFGELSEAFQYSGRKYDAGWKCPLKINHGRSQNNTAT